MRYLDCFHLTVLAIAGLVTGSAGELFAGEPGIVRISDGAAVPIRSARGRAVPSEYAPHTGYVPHGGHGEPNWGQPGCSSGNCGVGHPSHFNTCRECAPPRRTKGCCGKLCKLGKLIKGHSCCCGGKDKNACDACGPAGCPPCGHPECGRCEGGEHEDDDGCCCCRYLKRHCCLFGGGCNSPDHGWGRPIKRPIHELPVLYQKYWPDAWAGQPGWGYATGHNHPAIYMPTDTTQLGYYYQRVPFWRPNPGMTPPVPWPAQWHQREYGAVPVGLDWSAPGSGIIGASGFEVIDGNGWDGPACRGPGCEVESNIYSTPPQSPSIDDSPDGPGEVAPAPPTVDLNESALNLLP